MHQGLSHQFSGPNDDIPLPSQTDDIDFEAELGIITDAVPMGVTRDAARRFADLGAMACRQIHAKILEPRFCRAMEIRHAPPHFVPSFRTTGQ